MVDPLKSRPPAMTPNVYRRILTRKTIEEKKAKSLRITSQPVLATLATQNYQPPQHSYQQHSMNSMSCHSRPSPPTFGTISLEEPRSLYDLSISSHPFHTIRIVRLHTISRFFTISFFTPLIPSSPSTTTSFINSALPQPVQLRSRLEVLWLSNLTKLMERESEIGRRRFCERELFVSGALGIA